jgi:hypothetical protein
MRGDNRQPDAMFSYVSAEQRVPSDHTLRAIRLLVDEVLRDVSREFAVGAAGAAVARAAADQEPTATNRLAIDFSSLTQSGAGLNAKSPGTSTPRRTTNDRGPPLSLPVVSDKSPAISDCHAPGSHIRKALFRRGTS